MTRIPCNCGAATVGGRPMPHYHDDTTSQQQPTQPQAPELDEFGRHFSYWHGTNGEVSTILKEGLRPGSDGWLYLSTRRDFAKNYGKTLLEVRLPYELERNPFAKTINAEYRTKQVIVPEVINVLLPTSALLAWHLREAEKLIPHKKDMYNMLDTKTKMPSEVIGYNQAVDDMKAALHRGMNHTLNDSAYPEPHVKKAEES